MHINYLTIAYFKIFIISEIILHLLKGILNTLAFILFQTNLIFLYQNSIYLDHFSLLPFFMAKRRAYSLSNDNTFYFFILQVPPLHLRI